MAAVGGRPGIKGSCGRRRMRLKYLTGGTDDVADFGLLVLFLLTYRFCHEENHMV